jgi:hypothetical protein
LISINYLNERDSTMPKRPRKSKPEDFNKADSPVLPEPRERESEPNAESPLMAESKDNPLHKPT